jgi:glycosyltransferase involved in cell wall biosynthesis
MNGLLFVGNFLSSAGSNRTYCEELSDRLQARGRNVVRTSSRPGRLARLADMMSVTWRSRRRYAVAHVDVFSGAAFVWAEAVCFELRRLGKPHVLTLRGGNLPTFARQYPRRVHRLLRGAATVTAPSTYLANALASHAPHIRVIPNAIDVARYGNRTRREVAPKLVWIRAFHRVYNPTMALDALARCARRDAVLTMIGVDKGDGTLDQVRSAARAHGLESRVRLIPGVPKHEVARHLADADIFLNTTNVDNTPISVLEAMAGGLCVVSTNVGGIPHLVRNGVDALLVQPGDAAAMARHIERLVEDPELAERLSSAAYANASACDWRHVLTDWEALFDAAEHHA